MKTRRILWLYCVFAVLALAIFMVVVIATSGRLRDASSEASKQAKHTDELAEAQREVVSLMEEEQRRQRADLSGQEAIRMSAEVQMEQQQLATLEADRAAAEEQFEAASAAYQGHMKRLIPIIALLILHLVGVMLFWPKPGEASAAPLK